MTRLDAAQPYVRYGGLCTPFNETKKTRAQRMFILHEKWSANELTM